MGIILWIIFGAIVGWIASIIMRSTSGMIGDIILGGFNLYSFGVAIIGACVIILIGRALRGNRY
jgi:uncharacterized membrane protein YeaQ/YmgE (transglycosylase-associated protein family)